MTTCRHGFNAGHCTVPTCAHILPPAEEWRSCDGCFSMFRPWSDELTCSEDCRLTVEGRAKREQTRERLAWEIVAEARDAYDRKRKAAYWASKKGAA